MENPNSLEEVFRLSGGPLVPVVVVGDEVVVDFDRGKLKRLLGL